MENFPFSTDEWKRVEESTLALTNAILADDHVLIQALAVCLDEVLGELRDRHGEHPILLETAADFAADPADQVRLYRDALALASRHRLRTLSIRVSLAKVLLDDIGTAREAMKVLSASNEELLPDDDEGDLREWSQLVQRCQHILDSSQP